MPDKIYCYPNTEILKNKFDIQDSDKLLEAEILLTSCRLFELQKHPENGNFDLKHLQKIHKRIF